MVLPFKLTFVGQILRLAISRVVLAFELHSPQILSHQLLLPMSWMMADVLKEGGAGKRSYGLLVMR